MKKVIKKIENELKNLLIQKKLQIICKTHSLVNDIYSWSYFLAPKEGYTIDENEKQQFPTALELEMGVGERLISGKLVTVFESSDGDWTWIK